MVHVAGLPTTWPRPLLAIWGHVSCCIHGFLWLYTVSKSALGSAQKQLRRQQWNREWATVNPKLEPSLPHRVPEVLHLPDLEFLTCKTQEAPIPFKVVMPKWHRRKVRRKPCDTTHVWRCSDANTMAQRGDCSDCRHSQLLAFFKAWGTGWQSQMFSLLIFSKLGDNIS
jgi:hypothetical protein